jgi:uncharacterized protein YjbI with pentapeptide repeats
MVGTKIVTVTPSLIRYEGAPLGNDFFFHLVIRDPSFVHRAFSLKLQYGDFTDIRHLNLGVQFDYPDFLLKASIPFSMVAIETEANRLLDQLSDFGQGLGILELDFDRILENPATSIFELPIQVFGDYLGTAGREKNKTAELTLLVDVEVRFLEDMVFPSERILTLYERGQHLFDGEMLQNVSLRDVALPGINFSSANLLFANFDASDLYRASFRLAICPNAIFTNTHLRRAIFSEANVVGSDFSNADATETDFSFAQINSIFKNAQLNNTNFQNAHIRATNFKDADLTGANFARASLVFVDFRGANLSGVDFRTAMLSTINYDGAILDGVMGLDVPSTNFDPVDPFEGKSEEFRQGHTEGYERGYPQSSADDVFDELAWQKSLMINFPDASADFAEGYQLGFMESYEEGFATKGQ